MLNLSFPSERVVDSVSNVFIKPELFLLKLIVIKAAHSSTETTVQSIKPLHAIGLHDKAKRKVS